MKYMKTLDIVKSSEGEIGVAEKMLTGKCYGFGFALKSGKRKDHLSYSIVFPRLLTPKQQ